MIELIRKLKPQVVITGMPHFEAITSSAFENLLNTTRELGTRLFLDISNHFELSSLPGSNGVLKYLAGKSLPSHAAVLCGLVKNQVDSLVYSDLEVAFVISEDEAVYTILSKTVELLEGHTALFSQYYYGCLRYNKLLNSRSWFLRIKYESLPFPWDATEVLQKLVRLTFALEDAKSEQALKQITQFKKLVLEN
ncbi:hypothetical protein BHM03_00007591 [Ensete ventricosum]|nr:hypothetical protein BHM03_00007591 [Ensete ventricosum]